MNPSGESLWVNDSGDSTIELWDLAKESALATSEDCGTYYGVFSYCDAVGGIGIDSQGNVLVALTQNGQDVLRFPAPTSGSETLNQPDRRLFARDQEYNFTGIKGVRSVRGVAAWADQLIVSDIGRLMFWDGLDGLTNGRPADGVVGGESYPGRWADCCGRIKADAAGRLWVLDFEGLGYIDVYQLPLTEHSVPIHTIWKNDTDFPVLGTDDRITLGRRIFGIAPVGHGQFLWVADTDNHRVVRIRDPLTNPVVDVGWDKRTLAAHCAIGAWNEKLMTVVPVRASSPTPFVSQARYRSTASAIFT